MEPPSCEVTGEALDPATGRRLRFVSTPAGIDADAALATGRIVGDNPDEGWFSAEYAAAAAELTATHTLAEAVRVLRTRRARHDRERRDASRVRHDLDPAVPVGEVAEAIDAWLPVVLDRLGIDPSTSVIEHTESTSPSPEWRDDATATSATTTETWTTADHVVTRRDEDIRWDGPGGRTRAGELMQGVVTVKVDDTWLFAPFGADAVADRIDESGDRTPAVSDLIDGLLARLGSLGGG